MRNDKEGALDKIKLTIDGQEVEVSEGMTVLEAALKTGTLLHHDNGTNIPYLLTHPGAPTTPDT